MTRYIAEVQVTLTLEVESILPTVDTLAAILDSFAAADDPLLGVPVRIRNENLIARTRGAVLIGGSARLEEVSAPDG